MFKNRVMKELSHSPERLQEADKIAKVRLRRFIKGLIREMHTPKQSDLSPIGDFIGQTIRGVLAARRGDVEEADKSAFALEQFSKDPHYRKRYLLNEALSIADNIKIDDITDFYQATKSSELTLIIPSWRTMIKPRVVKYKKKRELTRYAHLRTSWDYFRCALVARGIVSFARGINKCYFGRTRSGKATGYMRKEALLEALGF